MNPAVFNADLNGRLVGSDLPKLFAKAICR